MQLAANLAQFYTMRLFRLLIQNRIGLVRYRFKFLNCEANFIRFQGKAKEKADLMLQLLGYPEWVQDEAGIDEFYSGVSEVRNQ